MSSHTILEIAANGIATLTLNRPEKRNAFNAELISELTKALKNLDQDKKVHVVLLKANGKHFCAGADLTWMQKSIELSHQENIDDAKNLHVLMQTLDTLNKPTLALAQGNTMGGGIGLLASCDIVLATPDAKFCFPEVKLGIVPAVISPFVIKKIGVSDARRYFLTAETFNAAEAKAIGLIHEIVSVETLHEKANELTTLILQNAPQALAACKQLIADVGKLDDKKTVIYTTELISKLRVGQEAQERLKNFLEKQTHV